MIDYTSFTRYLAAKKSVDDHALNRQVWDTLAQNLPTAGKAAPLQVLEIGAGIGTMVERVLEWGLIKYVDYTALDAQYKNVIAARQRLLAWSAPSEYQVQAEAGGDLLLYNADRRLRLRLETADLFDYLARQGAAHKFDLLAAHAFLDLVDIPATLPALFALCKPGGLFYFSMNFDGITLFEPVIDPTLDELILALYHRTMDERLVDGRPSGDSRSGRHLFGYLEQAGAQILAAGASDWVVYPNTDGYPGDEAYFLHFIINTIKGALDKHPQLDPDIFDQWITQRHAQIEARQLVYIAHQLDFAGRVNP